MAVPTPKPSRGAPEETSLSISYSSRLPLAMIWTRASPAWSSALRTRSERSRRVTGIEAHGADLEVVALLFRQLDDFLNSCEGVVGVDQENGVGVEVGEGAKGGCLVAVGLDVAVCQRAGHGNAEAPSGEDVGGRVDAGDPECASGVEGGVGPVHPSRAEVDDRTAPGSRDHAIGLRCQHGLQLDLVHHEGLNDLRLGQGGLDL